MGEAVPRWHTREDSGIRLDRELCWWHDDARVEHPRIIEAFNAGLVPTDDGRYQLRIGKDWCYVTVEDAAYAVTVVDVEPEGRLSLRLSDRTAEALDLKTLVLNADGILECRVKGGRAKARFSRDAQFALGSRMEEDEGGLFLCAGGERVQLQAASSKGESATFRT